jgi:pimeloyl-ACP methyl ester carboxylesterase
VIRAIVKFRNRRLNLQALPGENVVMQAAIPYLLPGLICSDHVWQAQVHALEHHGAVAVCGYGAADSITAMAESVLDEAPPRIAVAGHSMGARVALEMFRLAPGRIDRIALLDTGVHPAQPGERERRMALLATGRQRGMEALVDEWLPPMVHPDRRRDESLMTPLRSMAVSAGIEQYERQVRALLSRPDATPLLSEIDVPALVGVGRNDEWSPVAQHQAMAARIAGATLVIFEDSGHMAPVEVPAQVSCALRKWLEE